MILTVRTHYPQNDPNCDSDYSSIEILDSTGRVLQAYGDYYHDKGVEKVEGFLDALRVFDMLDTVTREDVADAESWDD